jgi:hypothetical protein
MDSMCDVDARSGLTVVPEEGDCPAARIIIDDRRGWKLGCDQGRYGSGSKSSRVRLAIPTTQNLAICLPTGLGCTHIKL